MLFLFQFNEHFAKKIPAGAEASNILVGELDFLKNPIIAFVRLSKACLLGDLTEVPVPTRFIFILLGPQGNQQRYHEIGRSIATLMSDEVCCKRLSEKKGKVSLEVAGTEADSHCLMTSFICDVIYVTNMW